MPRPIDQVKRDELVKSTSEVLARRGIDTSLRAVAAELDTTTRMLVHYFGSRDALVAAVLDGAVSEALARWDGRVNGADVREGVLQSWDQEWFCGDAQVAVRLLAQLVGAGCGSESPYGDAAVRFTTGMVRTLRVRLIAAGWPADLAAYRAAAIVAGVQGLITQRLMSEGSYDIDAVFGRLIDELLTPPKASKLAGVLPSRLEEIEDDRHRQSRLR